MTLAHMVFTDEDALICDFAEAYGILDFRSLPLSLAATLAQGLGPGSRIKQTMMRLPVHPDTLLLAGIADRLSLIKWMLSKDGAQQKNKPAMIVEALLGRSPEKHSAGFASGEDFKDAWNMLTGGESNGGN